MDCRDVCDQMSAYLDGQLPPDVEAAVRAHLDDCPECRALLKELRGVTAILGRLPDHPAPTHLAEDIDLEIQRRLILDGTDADASPAERALPLSHASPWPRIAAVAASLVLAVGIVTLAWLGRQREAARPSAATRSVSETHAVADHDRGDVDAGRLANRASKADEAELGLPIARTGRAKGETQDDTHAYRSGEAGAAPGHQLAWTEGGEPGGQRGKFVNGTPSRDGGIVAKGPAATCCVNSDVAQAADEADRVHELGGGQASGGEENLFGLHLKGGDLALGDAFEAGHEVTRDDDEPVSQKAAGFEEQAKSAIVVDPRGTAEELVLETEVPERAAAELPALFADNGWHPADVGDVGGYKNKTSQRWKRGPASGYYARVKGEDAQTWVVITDRSSLSRFASLLATRTDLQVSLESSGPLRAAAELQRRLGRRRTHALLEDRPATAAQAESRLAEVADALHAVNGRLEKDLRLREEAGEAAKDKGAWADAPDERIDEIRDLDTEVRGRARTDGWTLEETESATEAPAPAEPVPEASPPPAFRIPAPPARPAPAEPVGAEETTELEREYETKRDREKDLAAETAEPVVAAPAERAATQFEKAAEATRGGCDDDFKDEAGAKPPPTVLGTGSGASRDYGWQFAQSDDRIVVLIRVLPAQDVKAAVEAPEADVAPAE